MGSSHRRVLSKYARLSTGLAFLAALACGEPRAASGPADAGPSPAPLLDAGMDGGFSPDAAVDPLALIRAQNRALRALLEGQLPTDLDPQSLFEVDLLDSQARGERVRALERVLRVTSPSDAGVVPADGEVFGDGAQASPDAALEGGVPDAAGSEVDAEALDGGAVGSEVDPAARVLDGAIPDGGLRDAAVSDADLIPSGELGELAALELERDRLRLAFLRLPAAQQLRVVEGVRARRRMAIEEHASRADAERATRDALRATEASDDLFDQAAGSTDARESALLSERARIEATRADLARWEVRFARRRQVEARAGADRLQRLHDLESAGSIDSESADERYDEVVGVLVVQREGLRSAIDELYSRSGVPAFELGIDLSGAPYRGVEGTVELRTASAALDHDVGRAAAEEDRLRWQWTGRLASDLRRLDRVRVSLLPKMSGHRRAAVLGLGTEGRQQLGRELDQIATMARWWLRETGHDLVNYPLSFVAIAASPNTRVELGLAVLLALLIGLIWRKQDSIKGWLGRAVHDRKSERQWIALIRPFWAAIGPVVVPLATASIS